MKRQVSYDTVTDDDDGIWTLVVATSVDVFAYVRLLLIQREPLATSTAFGLGVSQITDDVDPHGVQLVAQRFRERRVKRRATGITWHHEDARAFPVSASRANDFVLTPCERGRRRRSRRGRRGAVANDVARDSGETFHNR